MGLRRVEGERWALLLLLMWMTELVVVVVASCYRMVSPERSLEMGVSSSERQSFWSALKDNILQSTSGQRQRPMARKTEGELRKGKW